jgi:hypothetical protein
MAYNSNFQLLQHIFVTTCKQSPDRPPATTMPTCHPSASRAVSYGRHTYIKGRKEWMRNSSYNLNSCLSHTTHNMLLSRSTRKPSARSREAIAPANLPPSLPLAAPHRRVLEPPPSPSPDQPVNRPLLSDLDGHQRGCQGGSCVIHGWDCPNRVAPVHDPSSSSHQGEEEEEEEDEDDECQISVVTGPIGAPVICRTSCVSIGPRGRPQGPLAP